MPEEKNKKVDSQISVTASYRNRFMSSETYLAAMIAEAEAAGKDLCELMHQSYTVVEDIFDLNKYVERLRKRKDAEVHAVFHNSKTGDKDKVGCAIYSVNDLGLVCRISLNTNSRGLTISLFSEGLEALQAEFKKIRKTIPEIKPNENEHEVEFNLWSEDQGRIERNIPAMTWESLQNNYPASVRDDIKAMMKDFVPGAQGKLLLWHGQVGTGKTTAIRALSWEWRKWASFHYITDPEVLFASKSGYFFDVLSDDPWNDDDDDNGKAGSDRWRVLILEDTGDLISADAREKSGQALSRMLNTLDGIVGQGFKVLVLITTNDPIKKLHHALTRYGRCASNIEFSRFTKDEASEWLKAHKFEEAAAAEHSLAELYGIIAGAPSDQVHETKIGFATD